MLIDIFRGRQKEARVERVLSEACWRKLRNASAQIAAQMKKDVRIYAQLGLLPITVYYVDSWLVSPTCFESTVLMGIGGQKAVQQFEVRPQGICLEVRSQLISACDV